MKLPSLFTSLPHRLPFCGSGFLNISKYRPLLQGHSTQQRWSLVMWRLIELPVFNLLEQYLLTLAFFL